MKSKVFIVISTLFGLMMLNSGLNKIFSYMPMPEFPPEAANVMMAFVESGWIFPLLAFAEITGGILIALPKTRALGAVILFPVTVGVFLFHLVNAPEGMIMGIVLLLINLWVIYENREKYLSMIQKQAEDESKK